MNKLSVISAALLLLGLGISAHAITIDTVTVGDPGNKADTTGYGSVSYTYNVGKYEVTAGQYCTFLNAVAKTDTYGLYNSCMWSSTYGCKIQQTGDTGNYGYSVAPDYANRPVNFVSFWDSCRFANWLGNGQKSGTQDATTTEAGAYTLNGYNGQDGSTIVRNEGAKWFLPSVDEWYKAAYYKGGGTNTGYWAYPTQSNTPPGNNMADPSGNNANYYTGSGFYPIDNGKYTTVVGEFQNSASAYGTFDQGGNVWELNEAISYQDSTYAYRGLRGGSFYNNIGHINIYLLQRSGYGLIAPNGETYSLGFRVCQAVPEHSSIIALLGGLTGLIGLKRRKA